MRGRPLLLAMALWVAVALACAACGDKGASMPATDLASPADLAVAAGDGGPGATCVFNRDCIASARCACANGDCVCETGPRGTGRSGVDPCTDGNDCASALCVEGPGGAFVCSGECMTPSDCGPSLRQCIEVALVGRICVRAP